MNNAPISPQFSWDHFSLLILIKLFLPLKHEPIAFKSGLRNRLTFSDSGSWLFLFQKQTRLRLLVLTIGSGSGSKEPKTPGSDRLRLRLPSPGFTGYTFSGSGS